MTGSDLPRALRDAIGISQTTALSVDNADHGRRAVDWQRFLNGSALALPEIQNGLAVRRRLATPEGDVELADMLSWIRHHPGKVLFLGADAGEGKSTYLTMLTAELAGSAMVFRWNAGFRLTIDELQDAATTARSLLGPAAAPDVPLVALLELRPALDDAAFDAVLSTLAEHESRAGEAVFIIAGRRNVMNALASRATGVDRCSFGPLSRDDTAALCEQVRRACDEVTKSNDPEYVSRRFPNLYDFVALPADQQADYFAQPGKPLIAGFLKAVYGDDFVRRLVGEYQRLAEVDVAGQRAYLHVCLATVAGLALPERTLRALAPEADLDRRSKHDPWVRTERDEHIARHAIIAQTVLERSGDYTALTKSFEDWLDLSRRKPATLSLLYDVVTGVVHMRSMAGDRTVVHRIRKRLADVVADDDSLIPRLVAESGSSPARLFSWARLLRRAAPVRPNADHLELLSVVAKLYDAARDGADGTDRALAERIEYHRDRLSRDVATASGRSESIDVLEDRVTRWRDFIGRDWADAQFCAELYDAAYSLASALTFDGPVDRDSDSVFLAYAISGEAFACLYATEDTPLINKRMGSAGELLNRYLRYALPTRHVPALKRAWGMTRGEPRHPATGIRYAEALIDTGDLDAAIDVLKEVLDLSPGDPGAICTLAELTDRREDLIEFLLNLVDTDVYTVLSAKAPVHAAAARIARDPDLRVHHLQRAVEAFAQIQWNANLWDRLGHQWTSACAELRRAGGHSDSCGRALTQARAKYQRIRR